MLNYCNSGHRVDTMNARVYYARILVNVFITFSVLF